MSLGFKPPRLSYEDLRGIADKLAEAFCVSKDVINIRLGKDRAFSYPFNIYIPAFLFTCPP